MKVEKRKNQKVFAKLKGKDKEKLRNIVKKGYNSIVDYSNLKTGVYHVNYDNKTDRIIVK